MIAGEVSILQEVVAEKRPGSERGREGKEPLVGGRGGLPRSLAKSPKTAVPGVHPWGQTWRSVSTGNTPAAAGYFTNSCATPQLEKIVLGSALWRLPDTRHTAGSMLYLMWWTEPSAIIMLT